MSRNPPSATRIRRFKRPEAWPAATPAEASYRAAPGAATSAMPEQAPQPSPARAPGTHAPDGPADMPVGIAEFGEILLRRWKTIAATTFLVTSLGIAYAMVAKPQFLATTSIFVDPRNRPSFQIESTGIGAGYDTNLVDSQIVLVESDTVLRRVIANEKLLSDAELTAGPGNAEFNVLRNLKNAVKVKRPDRTYVIEIQVRLGSGEKSARIANAIAAAYLSDGRDSKSETAEREQSWLDRHIQNLQNRLKEAEARVEAYKVENKILGVGAEGPLVGEQQLGELNKSIVDAQRKAAEAKALMEQVDQVRRSGKLPDTTNDALRSGAIERLRTQLSEVLRLEANARTTLGPLHPAFAEIREQVVETRRQINEELARIAEGARTAYGVARANVAAQERQLEAMKRDTTGTNQTLLRLRELQRAVEAQKAVYEKFLRDKEQIARLTVDTPAGRVIAPALAPQFRAFPNRPLIAMLAFVGGLMIGVGLALAFETLSRGRSGNPAPGNGLRGGLGRLARYRPALPAAPMQPVRATAQRRGWLGRRARPDFAMPDPDSAYGREIERLAHDIGATIGRGPMRTLLISGVQTGRSQPRLTAHLGRVLARLGWKVLLIDGTGAPDGLSTQLPMNGEIVELQIGARPDHVLHAGGDDGSPLFLLPFGGVPARSPRSRNVFAGACDIVLIDGPAVGTPALERFDFDRRIDGVIAVVPPEAEAADAAMKTLDRRFGRALMGVFAQAA